MKNGYNLIWTQESVNNLENITEYILNKFSELEVRNFYSKLEKALKLISTKPYAYPASVIKKEVHKCVLTKQTNIFYHIEQNNIYILSLFINKKSLESLKI